jgi:hypothetical protein
VANILYQPLSLHLTSTLFLIRVSWDHLAIQVPTPKSCLRLSKQEKEEGVMLGGTGTFIGAEKFLVPCG